MTKQMKFAGVVVAMRTPFDVPILSEDGDVSSYKGVFCSLRATDAKLAENLTAGNIVDVSVKMRLLIGPKKLLDVGQTVSGVFDATVAPALDAMRKPRISIDGSPLYRLEMEPVAVRVTGTGRSEKLSAARIEEGPALAVDPDEFGSNLADLLPAAAPAA